MVQKKNVSGGSQPSRKESTKSIKNHFGDNRHNCDFGFFLSCWAWLEKVKFGKFCSTKVVVALWG